MSRLEVLKRIVDLVGRDRLLLTRIDDCWPAYGALRLNGESVQIALFAGAIGLSSRNRDDVESRFQNPSNNRPMEWDPHFLPLLIGLWDSDPLVLVRRPVLFAANPDIRRGKSTRFSVFSKLTSLVLASEKGWSEDVSSTGEVLYAFNPKLLPAFVELSRNKVYVPEISMTAVVDASGVNSEADQDPAERARRATSALVRSAKFGQNVVEAYGGFCAICGLDFGLVQGAHIYPASAPESPDSPWNGIALCCNHHAAFDKHQIWINPESREVVFHPELISRRNLSDSCSAFIDHARPTLAEPLTPQFRPRTEMFEQRYGYFQDKYLWLG